MNKEIKRKMEQRLMECLDRYEETEIGSKERASATDDIIKLYNAVLKIEQDEGHKKTAEQERVDRIVQSWSDRICRVGTDVAKLLVPIAFYGLWLRLGLEFEKTGRLISPTFRGLWNGFRPQMR